MFEEPIETNELDNFLNEFEDKDLLKEEPISEPSTQDETKEEEKVPFHKDPKVQRYLEKEIAKRIEGIEKKIDAKPEVKHEDDDDYYVRLIGNDTPEKIAFIKEAKAREERMLQQAEERAFNKLSEERERELREEKEAEEYLVNAIDDLEDTFNVDLTSKDPVAKKTRVDFLKFVEKIAPKDSEGNIINYPDMTSAFETFQATRPKNNSNEKAKDLASRSMSRSGDSISTPEKRVTFDNIDEVLRELANK